MTLIISCATLDNPDMRDLKELDKLSQVNNRYTAIHYRHNNGPYEYVFVTDNLNEVKRDDCIFIVRGDIDSLFWDNNDILNINSNGLIRDINFEQCKETGESKYKYLYIRLNHLQSP